MRVIISIANVALDFAYCQDNDSGAIYIHGQNTDFANMDIDCMKTSFQILKTDRRMLTISLTGDGDQSDHGDGRCGSSSDTQSMTRFQYEVQQYSAQAGNNVEDVNANYISYVVFGNEGSADGYTNFNPQDHGIQPLSVMAVVCGDQLVSCST